MLQLHAGARLDDLEYVLLDGSKALRFDQREFAVFERRILKRPDAEMDYTAEEIAQAHERFSAMSNQGKARLTRNILAGLPGAAEGYTLDPFRQHLEHYKDIDKAGLRENIAVKRKAKNTRSRCARVTVIRCLMI